MDKKFDLSVELCGVELDNPVIPASGTFSASMRKSSSIFLKKTLDKSIKVCYNKSTKKERN